jgi:superfamily II DNA or RNA helicase
MAQVSLKEFVMSFTKYNDVYAVLDEFKSQSTKGFVYERLWDLVIKFGCCDVFQNDDYEHRDGNFNTAKTKSVTSMKSYIENNMLISSNNAGASDILMFNKKDQEYICFTSKYPKTPDDCKAIKDKSIDYFDVQKITSVILHHSNVYKKYQIYILVHDKDAVMKIASRSHESSENVSKYFVEDHILDVHDLNRGFLQLKKKLENVCFEDIDNLVKKPTLQTYFHQRLVICKTQHLYSSGHRRVLWTCKCRSGKSYMLGGYVARQHDKHKQYNVLIITPVVVTIEQFTDDLFEKYEDFNSFRIVHVKSGEQLRNLNIDTSSRNIVIMSKQLLDNKDIDMLRKCEFDLIAFDENHFGGTTDYSVETLKRYTHPHTLHIYMTATYSKTVTKYNIPSACQIHWDIEDEQCCRLGDFDKLIEKHGEDVFYQVLQEFTEEGADMSKVFTDYERYPKLQLLTTMFDQERYDRLKRQINDTVYGFSMETLFSLNNKQTEFLFPNEVQTLLAYISGSNRMTDFPQGDKSIFNRIRQVSMSNNNRTLLSNATFSTQLWFLPFGQGLHIDKLSKCLKKHIMHDTILTNFEVLCLNSKEESAKDIKTIIDREETTAKDKGKHGLIVLVAKQCSLGVSLPRCDVVFLLNNTSSADEILQMMYRSMTDAKGKTCGFVVDFNPCRVLNTLLEYNVYKRELNKEEQLKYIISNNLINIDSDMFVSNSAKEDVLTKRLLDVWKDNPIYHLKSLLQRIENQVIELNETDQKEVNKIFLKACEKANVNVKVSLNEVEQELPSGQQKQKSVDEASTSNDADEEEDLPQEETISISKDVLPFIIPLACLLTIKDNNRDFVKMLEAISLDESLMDVFNSQTHIWWNKPGIMGFVLKIAKQYVKKDSNPYDVAIQFKMELKSLIDQPDKLLELVNSLLKPKQKEKQDNGEVFTPMYLIDEEMNKLDNHYVKVHNKSIFEEPGFTWFDPACGMGNYPIAVYNRLMEGLKGVFPNSYERKKHILENMLYMSEFNKKNVFMCQQIFDINNEYNLNINEGDTLQLDTIKAWGVEKFDVVLGNPPYNKGGIRSHTGKQLGEKNETIWPKFVEYALTHLKEGGFLAYITPLSWLKKSHSLHKEMLERHVVCLKLWDNSCSKQYINADIPISLYIMENNKYRTTKDTLVQCNLKRRGLKSEAIVQLNKEHSVPLAYHSIFRKLIDFIDEHGLQLAYKTKTVKASGQKSKIPKQYSLEDMWAVDTYTIKEGVMVKKATEHHPDATQRKLVIANKASFTGAFIDNGTLSLCGSDKFYITGDNLEVLLKMLDFKIMQVVSHFTKYRQDFLEREAFTYIPDIRKLGIPDITEEQFHGLIGLTTEEVMQINSLK